MSACVIDSRVFVFRFPVTCGGKIKIRISGSVKITDNTFLGFPIVIPLCLPLFGGNVTGETGYPFMEFLHRKRIGDFTTQ